MAIHNHKAQSIIDIAWKGTLPLQEQFLWTDSMNQITKMPTDTTVNKFNMMIAILKYSSHLRMQRGNIADLKERMTPAKFISVTAAASQYSRDAKIAGHYLGELVSLLSGEIFSDTGGEYDEDLLLGYIAWEVGEEALFNDIKSNEKYWKFTGLSGQEYEGMGTKSIVWLNTTQFIDLIKWDLRIEWRDDLADFILDEEKIMKYAGKYRWILMSYFLYVLDPSKDDNKFIQAFNKMKQDEIEPTVTTVGDINITDNKNPKSNVDLEF